jgi:tetratricopeptide (TPR) repeat protein
VEERNQTLKHYLSLCCLLLVGSLWGCLEAIRRPAPDRPAAAWAAARADSGVALPAKRAPAPPAKKRAPSSGAKQVNEYAYWCIGKGLWQEARLHLEQAVQRDSLTASYHNNLAIIYEHLGLEEQAAAAYAQAQALRPDQEAYQANTRLFERRQRVAHPDSAAPPQTDQKPPTGE